MDFDYKKAGERIKYCRTRAKESQRELGEIVGDLSAFQIGSYEKAEARPTIETMYGIAKHYNVPFDFIVGISDDDGTKYNRIPPTAEIMAAFEESDPQMKLAVANMLMEFDDTILNDEEEKLLAAYNSASPEIKAVVFRVLGI